MTDQEIDAVINELKAWIKEKGISQADMARILHVSPQRLNAWLVLGAKPNLQAWLKIKEFLRKERRRR